MNTVIEENYCKGTTYIGKTCRRKKCFCCPIFSPDFWQKSCFFSCERSYANDAYKRYKFKKAYRSPKLLPIPYTGEEALARFVNNDLTKIQYFNIRQESRERNCDIYPSNEVIKQEQRKCYPPIEKNESD